MANVFTVQTMKDTTEHAVIKLTGSFDGSGQESSNGRIAAWAFGGALNSNTVPGLLSSGGTKLDYYGLTINRIWYDCSSTGDVELFWDATSPKTIIFLNGNGEYNSVGNWITIPNNTKGETGSTGNIGLKTRGMAANDSYTIILELRKENEYYQRGQFNDPAAFNYPPYNLKP
jgi:hypothetical protein